MTKEEILAMEVGGELDAMVQEQIFKKKVLRIGNRNFPEASEEDKAAWYLRCVSCGHQGPVSPSGFDMDHRYICFNSCLGREGQPLYGVSDKYLLHYSTNLYPAWEVKERLNGQGLLLTLIDLCPSEDKRCRAEFWDNMGLVPSKIVGKAEGEFAPEAICKAALVVVEV